MNRKALSLVLAGVLSASAVIPAFASGTSGGAVPSANGTEVYAGIVLYDPDARVKVEVPTLFAFVVNGTVGTDTKGISTAEGSLLLPNVKVKVNTASTPSGAAATPGTGAEYSIQTVGDGVMQFTNYSTMKEETPTGTSGRIGLPVDVNGNIKNEGTLESRNYWEHVAGTAITGTDALGITTEFKKYNIKIGGNSLNTPANGGLELAAANVIKLEAPINITNGINLDAYDAVTNPTGTDLAIGGITKTVAFEVAVGGQREQYKQVEESAKVGTIVWTISTSLSKDVPTAPDNEYLPNETVAP